MDAMVYLMPSKNNRLGIRILMTYIPVVTRTTNEDFLLFQVSMKITDTMESINTPYRTKEQHKSEP